MEKKHDLTLNMTDLAILLIFTSVTNTKNQPGLFQDVCGYHELWKEVVSSGHEGILLG